MQSDTMSQSNVCFLKTDPSFSLTLDAATELNKYSKLDPLGFKVMRHRNIKTPFNNFTNSLVSVLRSFMLRATSLEKLYDPDFRTKSRILNKASGLEVENSGDTQIAWTKEETIKISSYFDQLFTDSVISEQLESLRRGRFQPWVETMYVMNPKQEVFTEIQSTIMLEAIPNGQPMSSIQCNLTVSCIKCRINSQGIADQDHRFQHYIQLKNMISRYEDVVQEAEEMDLHKRLTVMYLASQTAPMKKNSLDSSEEEDESDDESFDV